VTINGTNFTGASSVQFNGLNAASFTVTSATAIQATVPAGATTGPLAVTTPGGTTTSASSFAVAPAITSFSPATGPAGTAVTITGSNFTGATAVKINGMSASFTVLSATSVRLIVPTGATTGPLSVTTPAGTANSAGSFTVTAVLSVSKSNLLVGTGTVTSSPAGINCGGTCSASYNTGTVVLLTATPDFLSSFNGWTGCDSVSSDNKCTVAITRARTVVANFLP